MLMGFSFQGMDYSQGTKIPSLMTHESIFLGSSFAFSCIKKLHYQIASPLVVVSEIVYYTSNFCNPNLLASDPVQIQVIEWDFCSSLLHHYFFWSYKIENECRSNSDRSTSDPYISI